MFRKTMPRSIFRKMMPHSNSMDITGLPLELYQHLFEFLSLSDVINLRLVCKFFNERVKAYRVKQLFFDLVKTDGLRLSVPNFTHRNVLSLHRWGFILNRPLFRIEHLKVLKLNTYKMYLYRPINPYLVDQLFDMYHIGFKATINKLVHLEHLEIDSFPNNEDRKLILPKLKKLYIRCYSNFALEIDAMNLQVFHLDYDRDAYTNTTDRCSISFKHPSSVKCLYISAYSLLADFVGLQGIEHLTIRDAPGMISNSPLNVYPNLKSVTILKFDLQTFEHLVQEVHRQRKQVKIYFNGIEITGRKDRSSFLQELSKRQWFSGSHEDPEMLKNYKNLSERLFWVKKFSYDNLVKWAGEITPDGFFERFNNLWEVTCETKVDPGHLINFLAGCRTLREVRIVNCQVPQWFLDQLPSVTSLYMLTFYEEDQIQGFDFKFLNRMFDLERFYTNQNIIKYEGLKLNSNRLLDDSSGLVAICFNILDDHDSVRFSIMKEKYENSSGTRKLQVTILGNGFTEKELPIKEITYEELTKWHNYYLQKTNKRPKLKNRKDCRLT